MRFISTSGRSPPADLREALFRGLAPDGGLYLPEALRPLPGKLLSGLRGAPFPGTAFTVATHLLEGALPAPELERVVGEALDFPIPLVSLTDRVYVLELFHGPTCAFKDVGARFMARLIARYRARDDPPLTMLVATSGDTGGAVAHAFFDLPGTRVVVLYPEGKVSPLQERQFTTLGGNVTALAVAGTFDDCQRLVKQAFADPDLRHLRLTSANSINIGRLLPQIFYYFHAWAQLPETPPELILSVPSGNLGNLTAGLMAKRLGLPVTKFVAATNLNDVVPEYLATGIFTPRASVATLSTAMDVGNPSNFPRMLSLYGGDVDRMREDVDGHAYTDDQTRAMLARAYADWGYLLDPHSTVACLGLAQAMSDRAHATGVFLATAHPAKFAEVVEPRIGRKLELPARLAACLGWEPHVARVGNTLEELKALLRWS
ncbi:MAG: threonine synthase [Gemmatimonadetes bacterium]|nr:threonine synthase [Gemmatimonadota bacterium]